VVGLIGDEPRRATGSAAISQSRPSQGGRLGHYSAFAGLAVGAFMGPFDTNIVNSMLPVLNQEFQVGISTTQWILTINMLIQSSLMLSFGRLGDMRGHKLVYVSGLMVFMLGALLCGLAPTAELLIAARAVSALGSSAMWSNSAAILVHSFPSAQRGRAMGLQSMMVQLGASCAPPVGGLLTTVLDWRAIFWVSIPLALVAVVLSLRFIERDRPSGRRERFDLGGAALYMFGLMAILLALSQGHLWGWISPEVFVCLSIGFALLGGFVALEPRLAQPMLDLRLFRERAFASPVLTGVVNFVCTSSIVFLLPLYLMLGRSLSPAEAGLILITQPLVMASITVLSGSLSDRIGSRLPVTLGMLLLASGLFLLSRFDAATPLPLLIATLVLNGLGVGMFNAPNSSAVMSAVPSSQRGVAAAILSTARTLGNTLGLGLAGAIFSTVLGERELTNPTYVVQAVSAAFLTASLLALVGAAISSTRPSQPRQVSTAP
jgi:EmrB/QacA subfamily drug resistance transporter